MRAVRFYGKEDVRFDDVPVPTPGPGQVRLKPAYVGICGTGMFHSVEKTNCELQLTSLSQMYMSTPEGPRSFPQTSIL